jgi:hypothetical protein
MAVKVTPPDAEAFFNQTETQAPSDADLNGHKPSFDPPPPGDAGGKTAIDIGCKHLPTMTSLSWEAIRRENEPPILFRYGNTIVRAAHTDTGGIWLETVTPEIMRHHLSNWAHWHKFQVTLALPPMEVIKDVLAAPDKPLPALRRVAGVPVFAADGSLHLEPGYNPASGVLYEPAAGFKALPVPDEVAAKDVDEANQLICCEVLVDFPFASTADRDNAVSLFLLPFVRDMIDGPTPNHLAEASMPGSGKGKLVDALLLPSVGTDLGLITPPRDDDEWRKQITSALIAGKHVILIDNVIHRLDSSALAGAWTGNIWDDRIIGQKEKANIPIRCVWVMTGNNIAVSSEIARRCVRIRLTPTTDRPEERTDFRHPDLLLWCSEHRAELVRAAHILVKWWLQKGMPAPTKLKPLGSYERWTRVMGGIMEAAGYTAFLGNYREFQNRADTERTARALFCATWWEWSRAASGRERVTTADLIPIAEGVEGLPITGTTPKGQQTSLGRYLKANNDVFVEYAEETDPGVTRTRQFRIVAGKVRAGRQEWNIEMLSEEVHEVHQE